jgi:hypothetical protein
MSDHERPKMASWLLRLVALLAVAVPPESQPRMRWERIERQPQHPAELRPSKRRRLNPQR